MKACNRFCSSLVFALTSKFIEGSSFSGKHGCTFLTKCATPSLKSAHSKLASISCSDRSNERVSVSNIASYTCRLMMRVDRGLTFDARSIAYSRTFSINLSRG